MFVFVSKEILSIFGVLVFSFGVYLIVLLCAGHGQVSCSDGSVLDEEDSACGAPAVEDVACWRGRCANFSDLSALVASKSCVGFAMDREGSKALGYIAHHDGASDFGI